MGLLAGLLPGRVSARGWDDGPAHWHLDYALKATVGGQALSLSSQLEWHSAADGTYRLVNAGRILMIMGFHFESSGRLDSTGLLVQRYLERRGRKEWSYEFNPPGSAHDRLSALRQTAWLMAHDPALRAGAVIRFPVRGQSTTGMWTLRIEAAERLMLPAGSFETWRLSREPRETADTQQLEFWLAPQLAWLPVRIRMREANGDQFDQRLRASRQG
jgi:hypothetical protein